MTDKKNPDDSLKKVGILTVVPVILLVGPTFGFFLGSWIDRKFQAYPWFTILFVLLGFVAAARQVIGLLKDVSK